MKENTTPTSNAFANITDADYAVLPHILVTAQAMGRITRQKIYIVDFFRREFLYVSDDFTHLCGLKRKEVLDMGFGFYQKYIPIADMDKLHDIVTKASSFCDSLIKEGKGAFTIFCDFNLCHDGTTQLVNHQVTPIIIKNGKPWLALCSVSLSPNKSAGNLVVKENDSRTLHKYAHDSHSWTTLDYHDLKKLEHDILCMSARGMTMNEIASTLCKSPDTIKSCKKNLFDKSDATSITEAVIFYMTYGFF